MEPAPVDLMPVEPVPPVVTPEPRDVLPPAHPPVGDLSARARLALTVGPLIAALLLFGAIWLVSGGRTAAFVAGVAVGSFVGAGKLVIMAGAHPGAPIGPWGLAALVVGIDVGVALIVIANMHHLFRLPWVGAKMLAFRETGNRLLRRYPGMRRLAWFAVGLFIAVPFQGTGSTTGVILGRLLGLERLGVVTAVFCGSVLGTSLVAATGAASRRQIEALARDPLLGVVVVLGVLLGTYAIGRWLLGRAEVTPETPQNGTATLGTQTQPPADERSSPPAA